MAHPRKFKWLIDDDAASTHLDLKKDGVYQSGNISASILDDWLAEGKIEFLPDPVDIELPPDIVLQVQNGSIGLSSLVVAIRAGIKER